jgi:sulfofructose kinase
MTEFAPVLVVGYTIADHVFTLAEPLRPDGKTSAAAFGKYDGGQAANVSATMATLGLRVAFLGAFGDDGPAIASHASLRKLGVDLSLSRNVSDCPHHLACVLVHGAQRFIAMYKDPRLSLRGLSIPHQFAQECAAMYSDGYEGEAALKLARCAAAFQKPFICDIEVFEPYTNELVSLATHVIAPLSMLLQLTGASDVESALVAMLARGPRAVVATCGADGAVGLESRGGRVIEVSASPCTVVDTTGAGDAYHAAYVAALVHGAEMSDCMQFSADVAALKCSMPGPRVDAVAFRERLTRLRRP